MAWAWWKIGGDELYRFRKRQGQHQIAGLLMPALRPLHMSAHTHLSDMWSDADGCVKSVSKRTCTVHNSPSLQGRRREGFPPCKRQGDAGECSVSVSLPFQSSNLAAAAAGLELLNGRDAERPAGGYVAVDFTIQPSLDMLFWHARTLPGEIKLSLQQGTEQSVNKALGMVGWLKKPNICLVVSLGLVTVSKRERVSPKARWWPSPIYSFCIFCDARTDADECAKRAQTGVYCDSHCHHFRQPSLDMLFWHTHTQGIAAAGQHTLSHGSPSCVLSAADDGLELLEDNDPGRPVASGEIAADIAIQSSSQGMLFCHIHARRQKRSREMALMSRAERDV